MSVSCSDQEFRPVKAKAASLPPGVTAKRCWCGRLAKVKQVEDFSDRFGMKFFMCANYDHDPPPSSASSSIRPSVCCDIILFRHICRYLFLWFNVTVCVAVYPASVKMVSLDRHGAAGMGPQGG